MIHEATSVAAWQEMLSKETTAKGFLHFGGTEEDP